MMSPTYEQAYQALLLQAANDGRADALFGDSLDRARTRVPPFLVGRKFPSVYLEHPLEGDPFPDVTILLGQVDEGTRVTSLAAGEHGAMIDFYARAWRGPDDVVCGLEVDTSRPEPTLSAVHFQPRTHTELVRPFCEAVGEPERADLYLDLAARIPSGWPLSYFGMFRSRPTSPPARLRIRECG